MMTGKREKRITAIELTTSVKELAIIWYQKPKGISVVYFSFLDQWVSVCNPSREVSKRHKGHHGVTPLSLSPLSLPVKIKLICKSRNQTITSLEVLK